MNTIHRCTTECWGFAFLDFSLNFNKNWWWHGDRFEALNRSAHSEIFRKYWNCLCGFTKWRQLNCTLMLRLSYKIYHFGGFLICKKVVVQHCKKKKKLKPRSNQVKSSFVYGTKKKGKSACHSDFEPEQLAFVFDFCVILILVLLEFKSIQQMT